MSTNPILVTATRSGLLEAQFRGAICIVDAAGRRLFEWGKTDAYTYPRSALKLIQVLPLLESGAAEQFAFSDEELAVMCASHSSEPHHLAVVQGILSKVQISADLLKCGTHTPLSESSFAAVLKAGDEITSLHNNCSGKHSGFLALAKYLGCDLASYRDGQHEVQVRIRQAVCDICQIEESNLHTGVDGCTAPNYAMPIYHIAWGIARLSATKDGNGRDQAVARMRHSMMTHPWMVAGTDRFCSDMMKAAAGKALGKLGAAGFYILGFPPLGIGAAIKIDAGITGPQYNVAMAILDAAGTISGKATPQLDCYRRTPIHNCRNEVIGTRAVTAELQAELTAKLPSLFDRRK